MVTEATLLWFLWRYTSEASFLLAAAIIPLAALLAIILRHRFNSLTHRFQHLSPEQITDYEAFEDETTVPAPENLSRSIIERATEIRNTLLECPTEVQVEMCSIGYRACANDMITLTHLVNEHSRGASPIQRFKLRRLRNKAAEALFVARSALPPGALRTTHQEQQ